MIKILGLCFHLLLLTISDAAVPLKLIPGDRSVVKKDGATHTITKYYVVPNDYDPNNVTNTTAAIQETTYSKTMASGSISENISESNTTTVDDQQDTEVTVKKINTNWGSDLNDEQGEATNQTHDSTESTVSMRMGKTLDSDDLGNLQVEPIIKPVNISRIDTDKDTDIIVNSGEAAQKGSAFFVENVTDYQKQQTVVQNFQDILEDLILSKIGIAVHKTYSQNLESFWKLIKINIDKQLSEDVLVANIEKLSLLLNIFTNLYQAVQLQQPVETKIEAIVEILTSPFVEKKNGVKSKAETIISGDYDEEYMSKCDQRSFKPQLNSKGTVLSETEGGKASDSLELENLEGRDIAFSGDINLVKISEDAYSNPVTVSIEPSNVLQSQFQVPYNLNVGVPDGYNFLELTRTSTLNDEARHNVIQQDSSSIRTSLDRPNTEFVSRASFTSSVNPDLKNLLKNPNSYYLNDNGNRMQKISYPAWVSKASAHSSLHTSQHPKLISSSAFSSAYTNGLEGSVYGGQIYDNNVPFLVDKGDTNNYSRYISKGSNHSGYANVPIDYGHNINTQNPINPNVVNDFNGSILVDGLQIKKNPSYISEASAHSELSIPVNYNVPTNAYVNEIENNPAKIQNVPADLEYSNEINRYIKAVNGDRPQNVNYLPTQHGYKYLVPHQPYGQKVDIIRQPSRIPIISGNQNLIQKFAKTYRLFTLQNLQNLKIAVMKALQMYGAGVNDHRALINLKNIISVILVFAENLEGTEETNAWYEKIFYKSENSQQPLQLYVYNLMRQRWLHELMLLMYRNNYNIEIFVQYPKIFSFLESWQFPEFVKNFVEVEELKHEQNPQNYNDISYNQNDLQYKVPTNTYDYLSKEVSVDLEKYATKNVIDSYKTHNEDVVFSKAGVKAEPDANAIVEIVQNFLPNKNNIETQENVTIDDKKVEMLKQIISFLRMKGYSDSIVSNLIRKLYATVNSTEGTGCHTHNYNFAKTVYDVIVPVLRRSGQS